MIEAAIAAHLFDCDLPVTLVFARRWRNVALRFLAEFIDDRDQRLAAALAQARGVGETRPLCDADEREAMHEELAKEVLAMRAIVRAACAVVDADKHPMLSRADAVKAGVDGLLDAVATWRSLQPPAASREEPGRE